MICLPSYRYSGPMNPTTVLTEQRREGAGDGVGAGLDRLLVHPVMGVRRQGAALAGLEVHDVVADRAAPERQRHLPRLPQHRQRDAEARVGGLGAGDGLEDQIDGRAALHRLHRVGDMGQHARLRRHVEAQAQLVQHRQQADAGIDVVCGRVDADHGVAPAQQQAVQQARRDPARVVGRVVRLDARREPPFQADGVAEPGDDAALCPDENQVLEAHDLGDGRRHLRRQARREPGQRFGVGGVGQQPVAESADGQMRDRSRRRPRHACRRSAA